MERYGFGLTKDEVLEVVSDYVNMNKIQTPFKMANLPRIGLLLLKNAIIYQLKSHKPLNVHGKRLWIPILFTHILTY